MDENKKNNKKNEINKTKDNQTKEDDGMNAVANKSEYKRLDFSKLNFSDEIVTSEDALKDVVPFKWTGEVLQGNKKVVINKTKDK